MSWTKNTIIIILAILFIITLYSYYTLSDSMLSYEKDRMEYITNKENELNEKEKTITINVNCSQELAQCKRSAEKINSIIDELRDQAQKLIKLDEEKKSNLISKVKSDIEQKLNITKNSSQNLVDKNESEQEIIDQNEYKNKIITTLPNFNSESEKLVESINQTDKINPIINLNELLDKRSVLTEEELCEIDNRLIQDYLDSKK